jgi:hypothetical protein
LGVSRLLALDGVLAAPAPLVVDFAIYWAGVQAIAR